MSNLRDRKNFNFYNQKGGANESITISLYMADWCGHCVRFKPEWENLKDLVKDIPNVILNTYTDADNKAEIEKLKSRGLFKGFPTIIITKGNETEYNGERTAEAILNSLGIKSAKAKCNLTQKGGNDEVEVDGGNKMPPQCGGSCDRRNFQTGGKSKNDEYYKMKYLKYKAKYMLARSRLAN